MVLLLIGVVALNGCITEEKQEFCPFPYMQIGNECCLDQNNNNICDSDECSYDSDCQSNHCVHSICRPTDPYCGDDYCDSGETYSSCPSDCEKPHVEKAEKEEPPLPWVEIGILAVIIILIALILILFFKYIKTEKRDAGKIERKGKEGKEKPEAKKLNKKLLVLAIIVIIAAISGYLYWVSKEPERVYHEGQKLQQDGYYENAIAKYQVIVINYSDSTYAPKAMDAIAGTYYEWGQELQQNKQYGDAMAKYSIILENYSGSNYSTKAKEATADAYYMWGYDIQLNKQYEDAIEKYKIIVDKYSDVSTASKAKDAIAQCYYEWGQQLQQNNRYEDAIKKYKICAGKNLKYLTDKYASKAEEAIVQCYYEWGQKLQKEDKYEDAIAKYKESRYKYSESYSGKQKSSYASKAEEAIAQGYYEWGQELQQEGKYEDAIVKYKEIQYYGSSTKSKAEEDITQCYYKWGQELQQKGQYEDAIWKYRKILDEYPLSTYTTQADDAIDKIAEHYVNILRTGTAISRENAAETLGRIYRSDVDRLLPYLRERATVKYIYPIIIKIGKTGTENALINALDNFGDKEMGEDYLNCGNEKLEDAAERWGRDHGYEVITSSGSAWGRPGWGSGL